MGRINVTSPIFAEPQGSNNTSLWCGSCTVSTALLQHTNRGTQVKDMNWYMSKLTWLVLGGDPVARSHRVEQFTAL